MIARSAPWPSSPAPSARREAALGLDRSARPSRSGSHAANGHLRCLSASKVRDVGKLAPRLLCIGVRREGKRRGFSYCFLLHTRPMILLTGAGRPVSGMYFVQAQFRIWQCPRRRRRARRQWAMSRRSGSSRAARADGQYSRRERAAKGDRWCGRASGRPGRRCGSNAGSGVAQADARRSRPAGRLTSKATRPRTIRAVPTPIMMTSAAAACTSSRPIDGVLRRRAHPAVSATRPW